MEYVFKILVLLFSVTIHEVAHGTVAYYLGDPTAKYAGRLSLNPLKHLDPFGSIILPIFLLLIALKTSGKGIIFGYAKPVPINPYNFRDRKYGTLKVALAGPASNFSIAVFFGILIRVFSLPINSGLGLMFSFIVWINLLLAVFNLVPIPPLDGSHILFAILPDSMWKLKTALRQFGIFILFFIIFFFYPWIALIIRWLFLIITGSSFSI